MASTGVDYGDLGEVERALREARERDDLARELDLARGVIGHHPRAALRFRQVLPEAQDLEALRKLIFCSWPVRLVAPVRARLLWDGARARHYACDCIERLLPPFMALGASMGLVQRTLDAAREGTAFGGSRRDHHDLHALFVELSETLRPRISEEGFRLGMRILQITRHLFDPDPDGLADAALHAFPQGPRRRAERAWQEQRLLDYFTGAASPSLSGSTADEAAPDDTTDDA